MRVLVYAADSGRCGYRLMWPAAALAAQGADIGVIRKDRPEDVDAELEKGADVIVMQRPMLRRFVQSIPRVQREGVTVVVDIDDDFTALHARNAVWNTVHPTFGPEKDDLNSNWLREACRLADLVTVTTPRLAKVYGGHGRVAIIPNHVPESYLEVPRPAHGRPVVGWTGAVMTHPDDLQETRGGVARAVAATGADFYVVGPDDDVQRHLGLSREPRATGWVHLDNYPAMMSQIDVGIVPLKPSAFNEAKSWLKMMEFSALGVPAIGSPTGPNVEFADRYGLPIARRPRDWERWVRLLVTDEQLRVDLGGRAREAMRAETIEGNCGQWWDVWAGAHERKGRKVLVKA